MNKNTDKKTALKRILNHELTPQEELDLLNSHVAVERQQKEWEACKLENSDTTDGKRVLAKIENKLWSKRSKTLSYLRVYAVAASVAICLLLAGSAWLYHSSQLRPAEMYVLVNGKQNVDEVTLPDGTQVSIGPGSRLIYPKSFNGNERKVELLGQAFFEVAKNPDKPFIVSTPQMEVTALGTAFEVFSFDDSDTRETVLLNGKVKVKLPQEKAGRNEFTLLPNQKITITKGEVPEIEQVDVNTYSSWRDKKGLSFVNERLSMIVPRLERWYGKPIVCDRETAESYRFSFVIENESLADVMRIINRISTLSVKKEKDTYIITGRKKH